ncbi:MAG: hypothetical protein J6R14_05055 [Bacteroidales bacterium]|nr:hypothetical protein [Bacteroidales bacterium]MBQ5593511.1 hypothetical protein [Bacteroidales bacterium]MBQ5784418.1 hypothetical protein [Bacteroidales bacterium]
MRRLVLFTCLVLVSTMVLAQEKRKYSDHYYKRTAQFEQEAPITSNDIVMLGDSLTEGGDWDEYFKDILPQGTRIINRGIVGDDAPGIYDRLHQILPANPKKIFFLCGVNDISHHITVDSIMIDIERVVSTIVESCPNTTLYIQSLLPFNEPHCKYKSMKGKTHTVKNVNARLRKLAKKYNLEFIWLYDKFTAPNSRNLDMVFTTDGLHINEAGYKIWSRTLRKYIK